MSIFPEKNCCNFFFNYVYLYSKNTHSRLSANPIKNNRVLFKIVYLVEEKKRFLFSSLQKKKKLSLNDAT